MEIKKQKRIALIGLGKIAEKAYLPIVANHPKVEPILCTRNPSALNRLAHQYRIKETYAGIEELMKNRPDAAMVHSATESHFQIITRLLQNEIPVFVDKPLCYTLKESEAILNLATQKKVLIYLGFNRRFAPLINSLTIHPEPIQIFWQKNRVDLPAEPRVFVLDDFIHVVDGLRFLAKGTIDDLQVFSKINNKKLESLHVRWIQNETVLSGSMNRVSGVREERMEYFSKGNKWQVNELSTGIHFQNEQQTPLGFDNWKSTLYKRGFVNMFEDWLNALNENVLNTDRIQDIWETHHLCECIVMKIQS